MDNLGLLYNKEYFNKSIFYNTNGTISFNASSTIGEIKGCRLDANMSLLRQNTFQLKTVYPGLLSGAGYQHEIGGQDDEYKLGFYFDYTTGLPVINGSSIKGMLRAGCESREGYITDILTRRLKDRIQLPPNFDKNKFNEEKFIKTVFEGKKEVKEGNDTKDVGISIYQRDIFHDAFPVKSNGTLFGNDYITHHEHPLKDPNPVQFLRVQPEVIYQFQFDLKGSNGLTAENKLELFKQIILDLGLGAKTNVGYGQFVELTENN